MIYFSSDRHLNHKNVIGYDNRPFESVDDMNNVVKDAISKLSEKDILYFLGDLCFGNRGIDDILSVMKCKAYWILGNHDNNTCVKKFSKYFEEVTHYKEVFVGGTKFILCHYPILSWNNMHYGSYMIHGHSHQKQTYPKFQSAKNILDVSWDGGEDLIYTKETIDEKIGKRKEKMGLKVLDLPHTDDAGETIN